jgi:protein TonB
MAAPVPAAAATVAPPAAATAPVAPPSPPTPYDELRDSVRAAQNEAETNPDALHEISFGLGMTSGYFSPLAEGKSLRPEIREYYLTMLRQINERWWRENRERTGRGGVAVFNVMIARDGTIIQQELARSSGNRELDDAMGRTLKAAGPFPPLPGNFRDDFFRAPLRFVPPLNLMAPASNAAPGAA